jgi:hypothetical protein
MIKYVISYFTDKCTGCGKPVCPDCGACPTFCDCR